MRVSLQDIRNNQDGFEALVSLWAQTKDCFLEDIDIDLSETTWFAAEMCSAFGAILYRLGQDLNTVKLTTILPEVEKILSRNGFLSHYGGESIPDHWGTTIPYKRFDAKDDRYFAGYIERELIGRPEIPAMSEGLVKKFRESIFEIFSNSVLHSQTEQGIFSCGQFYPKRKEIDFSVTDLGIGIRKNIKVNIGLDLEPEDAITWATQGRNTTKRGGIPGGLGLKLLGEFLDMNAGCIQIVSDAGYWRKNKGRTVCSRLSGPFPGTIVCLKINTADSKSYKLTSELSEGDIF